ncbi:Eukaryotic porin, partial [Globisporangium splendens]
MPGIAAAAAAAAAARGATKGISSCLYQDFLAEHTLLQESLEPSDHSCHGVEINTHTPSGNRIGLQTGVVSPFFKTATKKRGVAAALVFESQLNSMITSSLRVSSERHLELQAHLHASQNVRFTLEAHESATEKMPASFARIGCDYKNDTFFAGAKIDAVNGPTLQATLGARMGDVAFGAIGAYDVGLDHSDRLGRFSTLNLATSYSHDDMLALLQINDKAKMVRLDVTQVVAPELLVGTAFVYDRRKDKKTMRLRAKYALTERETLASSLGSDGILVGAYEWRTSAHLKTRVSAQMDVRHYDSDSHHLGVSIEIS